jgi:hypothetical protein
LLSVQRMQGVPDYLRVDARRLMPRARDVLHVRPRIEVRLPGRTHAFAGKVLLELLKDREFRIELVERPLREVLNARDDALRSSRLVSYATPLRY